MSRNSTYWLKVIAQYLGETKKFERHIKNLKSLSLSNGNYKAEFIVTENDVNRKGRFHEGLATTLVDVTSSYALLSHGNGFSGVSTNLHISHLQAAFPGDVLSINATVSEVNDPLAFIDVDISKKNGEAVIARGQHTMFINPVVRHES